MYENNPLCETTSVQTQREARGHDFLPANLTDIPGKFDQEELAQADTVIHLHYSAPLADWWVAEAWQDRDTQKWMAYGYWRPAPDAATLWDSFCLTDLERLVIPTTTDPALRVGNVSSVVTLRLMVRRDLGWTPAPAHEVVPGVEPEERHV